MGGDVRAKWTLRGIMVGVELVVAEEDVFVQCVPRGIWKELSIGNGTKGALEDTAAVFWRLRLAEFCCVRSFNVFKVSYFFCNFFEFVVDAFIYIAIH